MNIHDWAGRASWFDAAIGAAASQLLGDSGAPLELSPADLPSALPPLHQRPGAGLVRFWWSSSAVLPAGYDVERVFVALGIVVRGRVISSCRDWYGIDVSTAARGWAVHVLDRLGLEWWASDGGYGDGQAAGDLPVAWGSPVRPDRFGRRARRRLGESGLSKRVRRRPRPRRG